MDETRRVVSGSAVESGFFGGGDAAEMAPGTIFVPSFANVAALVTPDGLLLVDSGLRQVGPAVHAAVRRFTDAPLHTVVFTHGHVDHAFGLEPWLEEAATAPRIVAHRGVPERFRRYALTAGLNEHINRVQFGLEDVAWPREFFWPDVTYEEALTLTIGGERFELRHARGETDDATWVWAPERRVLCTGDLWIGCAPNCGNPQKVQRYPREWAQALERMAALGAEVLLPGHGPPITGEAAIREALTDAAAYLNAIFEQAIALLNQGLGHEEIVAGVKVPEELARKHYLQPIYDRAEFIVRNVIREYGGWWDGSPANLLPASPESRAGEIARLAGGARRLVQRARELAPDDLALACHLAEWALLAEPADAEAAECVRELFGRRASEEVSLMGRGIFMHAVRQAERALREER